MNWLQSWTTRLLALVGGLWLLPQTASAAPGCTTDVSVEPSASDNFYEAKGRLWTAAGNSDLRGILVLLQGTDSDARGQSENPFWQAVAQRERLGLLGVYFRGEGEPYEAASGGSGAALLRMVEQAAANTGLAQLARAPLLLVGHSSGAMFVFNFTGWAPDRVAAFVSIKTGPITANVNSRFTTVPGLFIVGEHDEDSRVQAAAKAFADVRQPAAWALAVEPNTGHEWTSADNDLIGVYVHALLSAPELTKDLAGYAAGSISPRSCSRNLQAPFDANFGTPASINTVWLPDPFSANAWAKFTKKSEITGLMSRTTPKNSSELKISPEALNLEMNPAASFSSDEIVGTAIVQIEHAGSSGCTFNSSDARLTIASSVSEVGSYRLDLRLKTNGLVKDWYRSMINVVTYNPKNTLCTYPLPILAKFKSAMQVKPSSLYLGVMSKGETRERTVLITSKSSQAFGKIRSISSSNPGFATATQGAIRRDDSTVICRFNAASVLGNQSGYFDLAVENGASNMSIRVPFIAFVSKQPVQQTRDVINKRQP